MTYVPPGGPKAADGSATCFRGLGRSEGGSSPLASSARAAAL
jgi:hypothetical protein